MPDVFISYARATALSEAQGLRGALTGAGISVFLDEEGIPPGSPFPAHIADALLGARIFVVFADETYFSRPWCVYEFQVGIAPYRALAHATDETKSALQHMVIALPVSGASAKVTSQLPPPLAQDSWPDASQTENLVKLISQRLAVASDPIAKLVEGLNDQAVKSLRNGALVPAATKPHPGATYLNSMPPSLKERFVGRTETLWQIFNALETKSTEDANRSCSVQGGAGMGKTQIAAEYVSRYGAKHYPGGIVWIDANDREEGLARQFHEALQELYRSSTELRLSRSEQPLNPDVYADAPHAQLEQLSAGLRNIVKATAGDGKVLWVVDNVPEPSGAEPPQPLSFWCPARDHVSLLCTSRRTLGDDVDTTISLVELSVAGAVDFLTQAPVKKSWLSNDGWEAIARWIGCLPLGLRILHTSLAKNFISATKLAAKVSGDEPAAALDAEVDALRSQVAKGYLHGVAEVLHLSYESLTAIPSAQLGAHVFSRLARASLPETFLNDLFQDRELGILSDRNWIQGTEESKTAPGRRWGMHRVTASYLRRISPDPKAELDVLADYVLRLYRSVRDEAELSRNTRHIRMVTLALAEWLRSEPDTNLRRAATDLGLALATERLSEDRARGLLFFGAQLLEAIDAGDELVKSLEKLFPKSDLETARNILHAISGLSVNTAAARFMAQAFKDPRNQVRWSAFAYSTSSFRADLLAEPLLDAYMAETNVNILANAAAIFETFLSSHVSVLRNILSRLAYHLSEADALHRKVIVQIYGRLLGLYQDKLEAGGWRSQHIRQYLLQIALKDADRDVAAEAATSLASFEAPDHPYEALSAAIKEEQDQAEWQRAVDSFVNYISALEKPGAPTMEIIEEDGARSVRFNFGEAGERQPKLFAPLIDFAAQTTRQELRDYAIEALGQSESGQYALQHFVGDLMNAGKWNETRDIAESVISHISIFEGNAYWWRGQAYDNLDQNQPAIADYGRVIETTPNFADAYYKRGILLYLEGDHEGSQKDFAATISLDPNNVMARYYRAILLVRQKRYGEALIDLDAALVVSEDWRFLHLKAVCLLDLGRTPETIELMTRCIELKNDFAEIWTIRGLAYQQTGQLDLAASDFAQAMALDPSDQRAKQYLDQLGTKQTESN